MKRERISLDLEKMAGLAALLLIPGTGVAACTALRNEFKSPSETYFWVGLLEHKKLCVYAAALGTLSSYIF